MSTLPEAGDRDPRIYMAAERTFLAWIRTALALMAFGFVVARVAVLFGGAVSSATLPAGAHAADATASIWLGAALILGGIGTGVAAAVRHARYVRAIDRGEFRAAFGAGLGIGLVLLLVVTGGAILVIVMRL